MPLYDPETILLIDSWRDQEVINVCHVSLMMKYDLHMTVERFISEYEAKAGSTVITLKADALQKLNTGAHTVTVNFDDGKATTDLTVNVSAVLEEKDNASPKTGDSSRTGLWIALMAVSFAGIAGIVAYGRRKKRAR